MKTVNKNSMEEIKDILSHDHMLAKELDEGSQIELWDNLGIKLKVIDVFDSTAFAIIYKKDRKTHPTASYAKVRSGDKVVFMKNY